MYDHGVTHFEAYVDFISLVLGCSPDNFFKEDFLPDEHQLDLDSAFDLLRRQFFLVEERIKQPEILSQVRALLERSYIAYKAGNDKQGAFLIQDFEELILKNARRS